MGEALSIVLLLAVGYLLVFMEIVVPGGVLGILGLGAVIYGCWVAFGHGTTWGLMAVGSSVVVAVVATRILLSSRVGSGLSLPATGEEKSWKSASESWADLLGAEGTATTDLRPAGLAMIDEQRLDVVADNIFLPAGTPVRVIDVEGRRIVVEAIESLEPSHSPSGE